MTLPSGTIRSSMQPFSRDTLVSLLQGLSGTPFTGYLTVTSADRLYLLFLFMGRPYAAGVAAGAKHAPLTITNFCAQVAAIPQHNGTISLHETDPVLLKCLLVVIQAVPTATGPVTIHNLKGIIHQIQTNATDALMILEKAGNGNFFFFLNGSRTAAYWSDPRQQGKQELPIIDTMLEYVCQDPLQPVVASIYQPLCTVESPDSSTLSLDGLTRLFAAADDTGRTVVPEKPSVLMRNQIRLQIVEGQRAGTELTGSFPCILGSTDADIVIHEPQVSKRHAAIQAINGKLMLIDLHSAIGTTLNNEPVAQRELKQGDRIGIGQTVLVVVEIQL